MRHKYETRGLLLSRAQTGEFGVQLSIATPELGLVRAYAQGVRRSGARLAAALTTLAESDVVLVRGKESWRVTGAVLAHPWSTTLSPEARERTMRVAELVLRLTAHDAHDATKIFPILHDCLTVLSEAPAELHEAAEILAALRALAALGFDSGEIPEAETATEASALQNVRARRTEYIARINDGIEASGL